MKEIEDRLTLVRDEVDTLQTAAAERKKPWFRQTPSLASVLALLVSIGAAVYSAIERRGQDVEQKHNARRGLVTQLLDLPGEYQTKIDSAKGQEPESIGALIETERTVIAEAADNLVGQIPNTVTSAEYNFLGRDQLENGGANKAEEYFKQALKVSREPLAKMIALRNLGDLYAQRGPRQNMDEARKNFQQAVAVLDGEPQDDATAYTLGFTWQMWGTAEYMNNHPHEGAQKFERARKYYGDLSLKYRNRARALKSLDQREQSFTAPDATTARPPGLAPQSRLPPLASPAAQPAPSGPPR